MERRSLSNGLSHDDNTRGIEEQLLSDPETLQGSELYSKYHESSSSPLIHLYWSQWTVDKTRRKELCT